MGIEVEALHASLDELGRREPRIAAALAHAGYPEPRTSERGYVTLLRTIVGQQVSIKAAASMWAKLSTLVGGTPDPAAILAASDETLRAAGLSRQKASYARSLAEEVLSGRLDLDDLAEADEAAIAQLVRVKGIGRWSAEIYLLFAEGRPDIWPAGESGMGYHLFQLDFSDGSTASFGTGGALDFPDLPPGKTPRDIVGVTAHAGRDDASRRTTKDYAWCLFSS